MRRKKTLAQLRAEKEERQQNIELGRQLAKDMAVAFYRRLLGDRPAEGDDKPDQLSAMLGQANRACELLECFINADADTDRRRTLQIKARLHTRLGQVSLGGHRPACGRALRHGGFKGFD